MKCVLAFAAACAALLLPRAASADSVTITGGAWYSAFELDGGGIVLQSDAFDLSGPADCGNNSAGFCAFPFPLFTPGESVNFSAAGQFQSTIFVHGTIGGETITEAKLTNSNMRFTVAPITIPNLLPPNSDLHIVEPFTMNGVLNITTLTGSPILSTPVDGAGMFSITLTSFENAFADTHDPGTFAFAAAPAPTPEPSTLILFGIGAAITGRKTIRRR